jgi:biopolymer transport protein TolR
MGALLKQSTQKRSKRAINSEINVTPFVDVMLVLLVIFMVTSPMLIAGVQVDLPATKSSPLSGQDEPIAITIDKNGQIFLQENEVPLEDLSIKLKAVLGEKIDTRIFVRGDKSVDYGKVVNVFSSIKEAGFSNVALVTEIVNKEN